MSCCGGKRTGASANQVCACLVGILQQGDGRMCYSYVYATFKDVFNMSESLEIDEYNIHASLFAVPWAGWFAQCERYARGIVR